MATVTSSSGAAPSGYASGSAAPTAAMTSVVPPYANSSVPTMTKGGQYSSSLVLSTVYATSVYTITSCAATVTDCPARIGSVTTDIISLYTTWCPGNPTITPTPTPYPYKAVEAYTTVVVTQYVDYCPGTGQLTTITYSKTQVLSASPTYEAAIPMYTVTKTWMSAGSTVTATLTIPSGAPVPTPEAPSYPVAPVVAGTTTFTVVPVQSAPVYAAAPVYPASNSNATANAGVYGAASGTAAAAAKSTYMASSGAGAKGFSFGAAVFAFGAALAML
jgi:chitinase